MIPKFFSVGILVLAGSLLVGCGGPSDMPGLGEVNGTVTLDGKPVEGAKVTFTPEGGRPSVATTDSEGHYELIYSRAATGAKVGQHRVEISTYQAADDEGKGGVEERIPANYNTETELSQEVKPGEQTIDFDLTTG